MGRSGAIILGEPMLSLPRADTAVTSAKPVSQDPVWPQDYELSSSLGREKGRFEAGPAKRHII